MKNDAKSDVKLNPQWTITHIGGSKKSNLSLTELPHCIDFADRVALLQQFILNDYVVLFDPFAPPAAHVAGAGGGCRGGGRGGCGGALRGVWGRLLYRDRGFLGSLAALFFLLTSPCLSRFLGTDTLPSK